MSPARIGAAEADISPETGVPMGGNVRADNTSRGVHDPIRATVVAVDPENAAPFAWVSLDLVATTTAVTQAVAEAVAAVTPINAGDIVVSATHTHSAPDVMHGRGMGPGTDYEPVAQWLAGLPGLIAGAATEAWGTRRPATVTVATAEESSVAFNRRLLMRDGSTRMNWEDLDPADVVTPLGPIDPELTLVTFVADDPDHAEHPDGAAEVIGALLHYTLHPAVLVGHDHLISSDWVDAARADTSAVLGDAPVAFVNGALGNVNHLDHTARHRAIGFDESDRIGHVVGAAAARAEQLPSTESATVRHTTFEVVLGVRTVDRPQLCAAQAMVDAHGDAPIDALDGIPPVAYAHWVVTHGATLAPTATVTVHVVTIGALTLVGVPFEVFAEFGLDLAARFPDRLVKVVSLTGDYLGYLPTAAAFAEGGYEPTLGTSVIGVGEGERLFHRICVELQSLLDVSRGDL